MDGLILAGGEGSRLSGERVPKPLLELSGEPLVARATRALAAAGCRRIVCMARADLAAPIERALHARGLEVLVVPCRTPSSLHTLVGGIDALGGGPLICTMVDTLMSERDFRKVCQGFERELAAGADAVLAVTPFVDDESAVYVAVDEQRRIQAIGDGPDFERPLVTGGMYAFGPAAAAHARNCVSRGLERVRVFLRSALSSGLSLAAVEVEQIFDIDRPCDLDAARSWLAARGPEQALEP